MLAAFEKCKLKFIIDNNVNPKTTPSYVFNPNSFLGNLIHKVFEEYYTEFYDLKLFDQKWEKLLVKSSRKLQIDKEYIKYWAPNYSPKKLNTFKILNNYSLLEKGKLTSEKKVTFKNVYGVIDLHEVCDENVRITDFKTGIFYKTLDGRNVNVNEAYIEQLKTYGYIIYQTEEVQAENIELVIKGLGNNEMYTFKCTQEEYIAHGKKIDNLINETNKIIDRGNTDVLATPEPDICNFCNHQFDCPTLHYSIKVQPEKWERIVLLKTINIKFDIKELSINILVNDRTISIHNVPIKDFVAIKKMNELGREVLITRLFQVHNSTVKKWSRLTIYGELFSNN